MAKPSKPPARTVALAAPPASVVRLQFVLAAGWAARLTAWYGQGVGGFSHVDAVLPDNWLLGARSDAVGGAAPGVHIRAPGYEKWLRRTLVTIPCTAAQARVWEDWLHSQIGKPYDQQAIWGFLLGENKHAVGHWICSACQTGALCAAGLMRGTLPIAYSQITPDALYLLTTAGLGGTFTELPLAA